MAEPSATTLLFSTITAIIAVVALVISASTFWLTHFNRGRLRLTRPMMFFFGWDNRDDDDTPKVTFRAALFSTASKGQLLENLYLVLHHPDGKTTLPFWGYDAGSGMVRGSGVHVPQSGLVAYHHFNPIGVDELLSFSPGSYRVEVWAKDFLSKSNKKIGEYLFSLSADVGTNLRHRDGGVLWSWSPTDMEYVPEVSPRKIPLKNA
ncbi:MAG: hypothetical protein ABS76_33710 [Pelagibacterium sp. SCN 64-44]|nr:MAG: hypothetical protein ABS76_33710 [Pelagibacterium sp. SCN 64-44]